MPEDDAVPAAALLVIDAQVGVWTGVHRPDHFAAVIAELVDTARRHGVPVIWVQQTDDAELVEGTPEWQLIDALQPTDGELVLHKRYRDAFADTELASRLQNGGIRRVYLCGAETDACVRSSFYGGLYSGFDVHLVSDAHTTADLRGWGLPFGPEESIAVLNQHATESELPNARGSAITAAEAFAGRPTRIPPMINNG